MFDAVERRRLAVALGFIALMFGFSFYIGERNGMSKCDHCGYTTYALSKSSGCKVPGCDQKTPHKDQR
jgi:hypothetical protein